MRPINQIQRLRRQSNFKDSLLFRQAYRALYNQESFIKNCILNTANLEKEFGKKQWYAVYREDKLECLIYGISEQVEILNNKFLEKVITLNSYRMSWYTDSDTCYYDLEDFSITKKETGITGSVLFLDKQNSKETFKLTTSYSKPVYKFKKLNRFKLVQHLNNLIQCKH